MKYYFVLFNKKDGEKYNSYSIVTEDVARTQIPVSIIKAKKEVDSSFLSKEQIKDIVTELGGDFYNG